MAKMFYTLEEVAEKLGKSEDEVKEMAKSGQIQEFRDRDKLMFKVEQIDLIAGGDDDELDDDLTLDLSDSGGGSDSGLDLADTDAKGGSGIALSDTDSSGGSGIDLTDTSQGKVGEKESDDESQKQKSDSREGTGISVFDTDHGEEGGEQRPGPASSSSGSADFDAEQTQVGDDLGDDDLGLENVASGSGLLDLTKESEDTALGAELLEEVYSSEDSNIDMPAGASGLFEATPESEGGDAEQFHAPGGAAGVATYSVAYDGSGSGLGVGMMIGALISLVCVAIIGIVGVMGPTPQLAINFAENLWIWVGGLAGIAVILGAVGWFIGRASE